MKLYATWQPLVNEDAQTALVFGMLRHLPVERALLPWLQGVLGRAVTAEPLQPGNFWPSYDSVFKGANWTEPELVFEVDDSEPLLVIVENKPGFSGHRLEQLAREAVDTAKTEKPRRIALIMVGADLGPPMDVTAWREEIAAALKKHDLGEVGIELVYSSWAALGRVIKGCAEAEPAWTAYVEDALAQLRLHGLLGYDGAPMLDDLEQMNVRNAVEAFNRTIRAARQFFLALHGQPRFKELGLMPYGKQTSFSMLRNGGSRSPTQAEEWFETTVVLCLYAKPGWDAGNGLFVGIDLLDGDPEPEILAGAFRITGGADPLVAFADLDEGEIQTEQLRALDKEPLPYPGTTDYSEWVYDVRPWVAGDPDPDVAWTVERLQAALPAWEAQSRP